MSSGLGRGHPLDPGSVGVGPGELPPLPDSIGENPLAGRLDPRQWFPNPAAPFELEIGSGKGTFLLAQAAQQPATNFLGTEWEGEFYAYAADRLRRAGLINVRMLHADATEFLRWRCPDAIVQVIHLYFSDPWPKARHHRRRVIQDRFLSDVARALVPGGELRIVTDHDDYWGWMREHFERWALPTGDDQASEARSADSRPFVLLPFDPPDSAREGELVGTNFERKYRREGRPFHAATLKKR